MTSAKVRRVEESCEKLRIALEACIAILGNSDCNAALYEHMKTTTSAAADENILAVRALVEPEKTT